MGVKGNRFRQWWHDLNYGDAAERPAFRRRLLDTNAFFWLAARVRLKPAHVWFAIAIAAGLWTWGAVEEGKNWIWQPEVYTVTALVLNTMLKLWIASEAARRFGEDRKSGALELLLSTPLSVREILRGQFLALRRQFLAPLIFVVAIESMFVVVGLRYNSMDAESLPMYFCWWVGVMIMLVADLLALSAVGMWVGLTAKNPNRATGITVARILVLPVALGIVIFTVGMLVAYQISSNFEPGVKFTLVLWFGLGIIADAVFGLTAWRKLKTRFREVAVQRYSSIPSFWRRLFTSSARRQ
jgi:ABC-type Na+ efflux pump permease subunit